jgi:glutamate decarboxylase
MGAGMVLFKNPTSLSSIEHHAEYVLRKGSKDLGTHTLEGSRPGKAMLVHSALRIIGRRGYELLIDQGIEKARTFARMIEEDSEFELMTRPELNLLTYRYVPASIQRALSSASAAESAVINHVLDKITRRIQKIQRAAGKTFVSRTRLNPHKYNEQTITVFRVVLANPLTTNDIMHEILMEQKNIASNSKKINNQLAKLLQKLAA